MFSQFGCVAASSAGCASTLKYGAARAASLAASMVGIDRMLGIVVWDRSRVSSQRSMILVVSNVLLPLLRSAMVNRAAAQTGMRLVHSASLAASYIQPVQLRRRLFGWLCCKVWRARAAML